MLADIGLYAGYFSGFDIDTSHLDTDTDIDAVSRSSLRISPHCRIVMDRAALGMKLRTEYRQRRLVADVYRWDLLLDLCRAEHLDLDTGPALAIAHHPHGSQFRVAVGKRNDAFFLHHQIPFQLGAQVVPHFQALLVEGQGLMCTFIRADHFGVAAGAAKSDVASFQHGDTLYTVIAGKVVGRCKAMQAAANDDYVIALLRLLVLQESF